MLIPAHMAVCRIWRQGPISHEQKEWEQTPCHSNISHIYLPIIVHPFFDCCTSFCPLLTFFHPLPLHHHSKRLIGLYGAEFSLVLSLVDVVCFITATTVNTSKQQWHWLPCHISLPVVLMIIPAAGKRRDSPCLVHLIPTTRYDDNDDIHPHPWFLQQPLKKLWNDIITMCKWYRMKLPVMNWQHENLQRWQALRL